MNKIDKIISIIRNIREEMSMTTASASGKAGFGGTSQGFDPGPTAGYDPLIGFKNKNKDTIDFRRVHPNYKKWVKSLKK